MGRFKSIKFKNYIIDTIEKFLLYYCGHVKRKLDYTLVKNNNENITYWKIRKRRPKVTWHAGIEAVVKNKLLKVGQ